MPIHHHHIPSITFWQLVQAAKLEERLPIQTTVRKQLSKEAKMNIEGQEPWLVYLGRTTVDILAPGTDIVTTDDGAYLDKQFFGYYIHSISPFILLIKHVVRLACKSSCLHPGGSYSVVSGTSFASPMGAATAALIWSKYPELEYTSVIDSIVQSCDQKIVDGSSKSYNYCIH